MMTCNTQTAFCHNTAVLTAPVRLGTLMKWLRRAYGVSRQRRELATLSNAALRDMGLSREAALREAAKPFWDLP